MKIQFNPSYLPHITLSAGAAGLLLRLWLFATGVDDKGLIVRDHPATWLVWALSIATVLVLVLGSHRLLSAPKYSFNFPASAIGGIGTFLAAAGILICTVVEFTAKPDAFGFAVCFLGLLSVPALCFIGHCRRKGSHPSLLFHTLVSIYLLLRLVWMYRQWSSDPQLQDYAFQLLALVFLMLACYHRTAFDANSGIRRLYVIFNLAAVYFCLVALPGCDSMVFFLSTSVWMLTDLCSLLPMQPLAQEEA